ncbi:MAG: 2-hydroxyglutaryl-CoA dehydratase [Armatimonadetes bacterium CG07_land_8_20_14_0_80_40_9]|nr:MAG: 2-hydroxyglutaryl-CoA dehydratase [Armatimonadetes bacterium CG07_land_8_20_14_0_80_40_9]
MYFAGIDLGSTMTKVVIIDKNEKICSRVVAPTGAEQESLAKKVMGEALKQANLSFEELSYIIATGYGRVNIPFADRQITELTCHTKGVTSLFPAVRIAIDIGGQDSKGLKIKEGKLIDFAMNDKCAAGTGRFLEVTAQALGLKVEDLGSISLKSTNKIKISSTCTLFAQQEVISSISEGMPLEDIIAGLHDALISRVVRMIKRLKLEPEIVFTGGVAKNVGVVKALKENLGMDVLVPKDPLLSGALGAALLGKELTLTPK